jgi:hypothetical protein
MTEGNQQETADLDEGTRKRFDLDLFIVHPTLDPAEITAALGLAGHFMHRVGDQRRTPTGTPLPGKYRDTRWRHCIRYEINNQWFAGALTTLMNQLVPHKAFFGSLRSTGGRACVIIKFLGDDGYFGDQISADVLARLVDLDLGLGIECYSVPQS